MKRWLEILQRRPIRAPGWTSTKAPSRVSAPISQPYKLTNGLSWTPGPSRTSSATHAYRPDSSRFIAAPLFHRAVDRDRTSLLAEGHARSFDHAHYRSPVSSVRLLRIPTPDARHTLLHLFPY